MKSSSADEEDPNPSWLDADNDDEYAPLFGTGKLKLQDEVAEEQTKKSSQSNSSKYGSTENSSRDGEGSNGGDEESPAEEPSVVSGVSTSTKNSKASKQQQQPPQRTVILTESGKPEMPGRNCVLDTFRFIEWFGVVTSLCLMATQIIPFFFMTIQQMGVIEFIQKIYVTLFCLLFIVVESDIPFPFMKEATFLQAYFSRGFLYSFLGVATLEEAYSERVKDMIEHSQEQFRVSWLGLFMEISSFMMVGLGIVYMLLGICCLKLLRDRLKRKDKEKWEDYKEALKVWRERHPDL